MFCKSLQFKGSDFDPCVFHITEPVALCERVQTMAHHLCSGMGVHPPLPPKSRNENTLCLLWLEISMLLMVWLSHLSVCLQAFQSESGGSTLVFCQMCLLRTISLSDPIWLPNTRSGKLPDEELQLPQPLSVPGVSQTPTKGSPTAW